MSVKKTVFPPKKSVAEDRLTTPEEEAFDALSDLLEDSDRPLPPSSSPSAAGRAARGRAAYAASPDFAENSGDKMPHFEPHSFSNPFAGLFSSAQPAHDPERSEQGPPGETFGESAGDTDPASIPDSAIAGECRLRVCPSCPVKKEADEERLRALAELDNARKRLNRERDEQVRYAAENVLNAIIPSLDNLDLALQHTPDAPACRDFVTGVRMTRKLMQESLAAQGLEQVGQVGEEFNPALHEAVGMLDVPDIPEGHICALLTSGYRLRDRLLRPARVMVCKKQ
ncbi:MAG: nucleotide exchange factor GrpE [Desulfovibrio sp.]|nr:nucleotide exchange factor GrpE [Desulfovibrio sp.]